MEYKHQVSKRVRRIKIQLLPSGEVYVITPPNTPITAIETCIADYYDWIKQAQKKQITKTILHNTNFIYIFGSKYKLIINNNSKNPSFTKLGFWIKNSEIIYNSITGTDSRPSSSQINQFLKSTAESYLIPRVSQLAVTMNLCYNRVSLKQQRSRWGSCSNSGNLNFNWRLVHFEPKVIDYVIIHELAHLVHQNHSQNFWRLVAQFDPQYNQHRKVLNQYYW